MFKKLGSLLAKPFVALPKLWLKVPKETRYKVYKKLAEQGIKVAEKKFKNK